VIMMKYLQKMYINAGKPKFVKTFAVVILMFFGLNPFINAYNPQLKYLPVVNCIKDTNLDFINSTILVDEDFGFGWYHHINLYKINDMNIDDGYEYIILTHMNGTRLPEIPDNYKLVLNNTCMEVYKLVK